MSKNDLLEILCKRELSPAQINLMKCIREAGVAGISKQDLADEMRDGNIRSVNGIFLGLSRRIDESGDASCPEFFNYFEPRFCMHPNLWFAIQELPELKHAIENMSVEEIYETYDDDALELDVA